MSSLTVINGLQSEIFVPVTPPPVWAPVTKPLSEMKVAIATACFPLIRSISWQKTE